MIGKLANENLVQVVGLLHAVGKFAEMVLASRDVSELHGGLAILGEAAAVDRVYTFRIQGSPGTAILDQAWVASPIPDLPHDLCIQEGEIPGVFATLRRGEAYQGHPKTRECVNAELNDHVQTLSDLILPITVDGELVGAIGFDDCHNVRSWSEEEIRVLKSAAATIAAAIQRQQAEVEAQEAVAQEREKAAQERELQALRRAEELSRSNEVLSDCIRDLKDIEDLEGFLESVLLASERISGSVGVAAFVYGSDHRLFMKAYVQGGTPRDILNDPEMAVWRDPVEWTHGFSEIWKDICGSRGYWFSLADDPKIDRKYRDWHKDRGQSFTLCVPLTQEDRFLGFLELAFQNNQQVNPERVELIRSLAQQTTLAVEANRLALQARDEAVRREQQRAVHERAAELVKANEALRNCVDEITQQVTADGILGSFLGQAVKVSGSAAGAILRRIGATEFEFVLVHRDGITASAEDVISAESNDEVRRASAADPKGYFADIAAGTPRWRRVDEILDDDLPTITQFQREAGNQMLYDFPYRSGGEVAGYLALAFVSPEPPSVVVQETISALATQVGLALEFRRISVQMEQAAVEKEQEKAAKERAAELTKANQALQATADAIATLRELDEIVPAILKIIARTFEGPSAAYYEIGEDSTIYLRYYINEGSVISGAQLLAGNGAPPYDLPRILAAGFKVSKDYSETDDYRKLKTRVIDHRRGTSEPMFDAWRRKHNREMELNIPLMMGGEPLGVLTLSREAERPYTDAEIELAEAVVKQFCVAIQASRIAADSGRKAVAIAIAQEQEMAAQTAAAEMARANNELALRNRLLSVVADVSTRLARIGDISASLQEALETIGVAGQFSRVLVLEERLRPSPEEGSDHLVRAEWCAPEIESHADFGTSVIPSDIAEAFLNKLRLGRAFWCRLEEVPYPMRYMCERMGIKATGCAPLMVDGRYWGNVAFDDCVRPEPWDTAHVDALKAIAQAISNALQARRDAERLASEREIAAKERATALARANQSLRSGASILSQSSSPEDVLSLVLRQALDVTGADTATLVERNGEGSEFAFRTFLVKDGSDIRNLSVTSWMPKFHLTPHDDTYFSHLLLGKPGQISIDAEVAKRCPASEHIFCRGGEGVMWAFPFMTQGVLKGYMALGFDARHTPDSVGLETAEALACQASLVLETLSLTEKTKALEAVREREMAVQNERTRLSEEMHDGLQQTMAAISLQVGSALVRIGQDPQGMQIRKPLKRAAELAEQGLKEIRDAVRDLSVGSISSKRAFLDAVSKLCTSIDTDSTRCVAKITCELNELPATSLQNIYRVIQEAAQNVVKHAGARYMEITVRSTPSSFIFTVSDDGCGITLTPTPAGGMGFKLMKERARRVGGRLEIVKLEQGGTQVSLVVEKPRSKVQ